MSGFNMHSTAYICTPGVNMVRAPTRVSQPSSSTQPNVHVQAVGQVDAVVPVAVLVASVAILEELVVPHGAEQLVLNSLHLGLLTELYGDITLHRSGPSISS